MPPQYWLYGLTPLNHSYTLARISCWPPEDGSICDPKHVGVNFTWTFSVFLINIELWVHELVIIETGHIDARSKHEVYNSSSMYTSKWSCVAKGNESANVHNCRPTCLCAVLCLIRTKTASCLTTHTRLLQVTMEFPQYVEPITRHNQSYFILVSANLHKTTQNIINQVYASSSASKLKHRSLNFRCAVEVNHVSVNLPTYGNDRIQTFRFIDGTWVSPAN